MTTWSVFGTDTSDTVTATKVAIGGPGNGPSRLLPWRWMGRPPATVLLEQFLLRWLDYQRMGELHAQLRVHHALLSGMSTTVRIPRPPSGRSPSRIPTGPSRGTDA